MTYVTVSYEPFERLIASLRDDSLIKESDLLHHMIHNVAWTTGSELIGELGQVITKIKKERFLSLSENSKDSLRAAIGMVSIDLPW